MKHGGIALALLVISSAVAVSAQPSNVITVITLNTKHGGESPWNPDEQIAVIAATHPDIVFLQEALYLQLNQYVEGINRALRSSAWHGVYARHCVRGAAPNCAKYGAESVMVLTRFPIADADAHLIWARDNTWVARGVARVAVRLDDGTDVQTFSCHLPAGPAGKAARPAWVAEFTRWARRFSDPALIGGDFNDGPATATIRLMQARYVDAWARKGGGPGRTDSDDDITYTKRFDYLFSTSALAVESADVPPVKISDHRPVVATYRVQSRRR